MLFYKSVLSGEEALVVNESCIRWVRMWTVWKNLFLSDQALAKGLLARLAPSGYQGHHTVPQSRSSLIPREIGSFSW